MSKILKRYELKTRREDLDAVYPGAEVWSAGDTIDGSDVTIVAYVTGAGDTSSTTKRRLWSAEVRKLFRLSCQPFDPSLIGFVDGGSDSDRKWLVLVMQPVDLPSVDQWARNATDAQPCFSQWRGSNQEYRAEIWGHIGHLFKALSALHESRIVHRRVQPTNLFIDGSTGIPQRK